MTASPPATFIARILTPDGRTAGLGMWVGPQRVITCAHVVNVALGVPPDTVERPERNILLDLPLLGSTHSRLEARPEIWLPPDQADPASSDVAGLIIVHGTPPTDAEPATFASEPPPFGVPARVFGYPAIPPRPEGAWVSVILRGPVGSSRVQLDSAAEAAIHIQPGFSGSPIYDDSSGLVLGMVAQAPNPRAGLRDSYGILAPTLLHVWPDAGLRRRRLEQTGRPDRLAVPPLVAGAHRLWGRSTEMQLAKRKVERLRGHGGSERVLNILGQPGVGKSALAASLAMDLAATFTGGRLIASLGAFSTPVDPFEVLGDFLFDLGVETPASYRQRILLYRRLTVERDPLLVLLDDARDWAQVEPLLPAGESSIVVVTSRAPLPLPIGSRLRLEPLNESASLRLLEHFAGRARVRASADASRRLVRLCGGLPLALRITGGRLADMPGWSVDEYIAQLQDAASRAQELQTVYTSVSLSGSLLPREARRGAAFLSLVPAVDVPAWVLTALAGTDLAAAEQTLRTLMRAQLLEDAGHDRIGQRRYRFHDLTREALSVDDAVSSEAQRAALVRLLEATTSMTIAADRSFAYRVELEEDVATTSANFPWRQGALVEPAERLSAHYQLILTLIAVARTHRLPAYVHRLANSMANYADRTSRWRDLEAMTHLAIEAAEEDGDRYAAAVARRNLSRACVMNRQWDKAKHAIVDAIGTFSELDAAVDEAISHRELGRLLSEGGDWEGAERALHAAISIFEGTRDIRGLAVAKRMLAGINARLGRPLAQVMGQLDESRPVFEKLADIHSIHACDLVLAEAYLNEGHHRSASDLASVAAEGFLLLGDRRRALLAFDLLAISLDAAGELEAAERSREHAATLRAGDGDQEAQLRRLRESASDQE